MAYLNLTAGLRIGKPSVMPYLDLPGTDDNYASTPDSAAASVTGDIDIRFHGALSDWNVLQGLVAKYTGGTGGSAYALRTNSSTLLLSLNDGSSIVSASGSVAHGIAAGAEKHVRATWRTSDGRVQFFLSDDGETWTQLGTDQSIVIASIHNSNHPLEVGAYNNGTNTAAGKVYRARVYGGIDGGLAADFNPADRGGSTTSITSTTTGEVWTINQSGDPSAELKGGAVGAPVLTAGLEPG